MRGYSLDGVNRASFISESPGPPGPPGCPATGTQALRHELRTKVQRPAHVGATPVAEQPSEPLRGELEWVTSATAEVTNLNQDLTAVNASVTHLVNS